MKHEIEIVSGLLAEAECPLFITGAGVSTGAGLPTYRGIGGLYEGKNRFHLRVRWSARLASSGRSFHVRRASLFRKSESPGRG